MNLQPVSGTKYVPVLRERRNRNGLNSGGLSQLNKDGKPPFQISRNLTSFTAWYRRRSKLQGVLTSLFCYNYVVKLSEARIDKTQVRVFSSFEESDEADRLYWHFRTPAERLAALELMRQSAYGYDDSTTRRLPGDHVLEIIRGE